MVSNLTSDQILPVNRNESRFTAGIKFPELPGDISGSKDAGHRTSSGAQVRNQEENTAAVPAALIQEKVLIGDTDMPQALQVHAVRAASEALDMHEVTDFKEIAYYVKNQFDKAYGSGWQCVTGVTFGSFVTHSSGTFIHFCLGRLAVMLFKAAS